MLPPIAGRFIAGETTPVALDHVSRTNDDGIGVILNLLGEHYERREPADEDADTYVQLLSDLEGTRFDARISVKPTQLGLSVDEAVFRENLDRVIRAGQEHDRVVWIDMEGATTTDATLDAFEAAAREYGGGVGVCLQSNLRRTPADLERLADVPGRIRLVKGAYDEPPAIAHTNQEAVDEAFRDDLAFLFREYRGTVAVGSHDPAMITRARELGREYGREFEIQMLMGVREAAQRELAAEGLGVWQYAPFGKRWLSYVYRRMRERRENLLFAARAIVGR
jgi:proline dehydrogenase